jgi:hypothetical protein
MNFLSPYAKTSDTDDEKCIAHNGLVPVELLNPKNKA